MASVDLIADEIYYRGYLVALLVQSGVPASVAGEFENHLNAGTLFEEDKYECSECNEKGEIRHLHDCSQYISPSNKSLSTAIAEVKAEESIYDCAMDDVLRSMKPFAKGGLVKWTDLERIIQQLREEGEVE